jgi:hypothetical protein
MTMYMGMACVIAMLLGKFCKRHCLTFLGPRGIFDAVFGHATGTGLTFCELFVSRTHLFHDGFGF